MNSSKKSHRGAKHLWMRAVFFVALRDLVWLIAESPKGLRAGEMEKLARQGQVLRTRKGRVPSPTTVYHYRNVLLHLGILERQQQYYVLNRDNPCVDDLMNALCPGQPTLSPDERRVFSDLTVRNLDCRHHFFDLFMPNQVSYDLDEFVASGQQVIWKPHHDGDGRSVQLFNPENPDVEHWLRTEDEVQAVLYGIRYWARNELSFLDELFLEDLGGVMYPVDAEGPLPDPSIVNALLNAVGDDNTWTVLSIRDLARSWGSRYHVPLERIFRTLLGVYRSYSEYIVLIPTAEAFATITAGSPGEHRYQLRSYLQDEQGRYISHMRIHHKLKERFQWTALSCP